MSNQVLQLYATAGNAGIGRIDSYYEARARATKRFWRIFSAAQINSFLSRFTGRNQKLLNLNEVAKESLVGARRYVGLDSIAIDQIQGSEGRSKDFDSSFRPLDPRIRDRWLNVAAARLCGRTLPPVDLIKVGDIYFVRDGHHRISVAKANGQDSIDATVTEWEIKPFY